MRLISMTPCVVIWPQCVNSSRPEQNGRHFADDIFRSTFENKKLYKVRLKFHSSLFPRVQLTILQHWFRYWPGAYQETSHYLIQWWLDFWHMYASLGPDELMHVMSNHAWRYGKWRKWSQQVPYFYFSLMTENSQIPLYDDGNTWLL